MAELEGVRLQSVVRRLRTTDRKRTPFNSVMCAFAPQEKILRRGLSDVWDQFDCELAFHSGVFGGRIPWRSVYQTARRHSDTSDDLGSSRGEGDLGRGAGVDDLRHE